MVGLATGLAEAGFIPFTYSIATFASLRPYEFIRNGPALHRLPVRIVGVGGGIDYGHNGVTHFALEDVGGDARAARRSRRSFRPTVSRRAPRSTRSRSWTVRCTSGSARVGEPVPGLHGRFELGRLEVLGDGDDVALVALGPLAHAALAAESCSHRKASGRRSRWFLLQPLT